MSDSAKSCRVTVIGGVSGLAAACALAKRGYRVRLLERRPYVGGRASSYAHPGTGEVIDNCQLILLGYCTNLPVYLAGDWTATGWSSTMESGVRSGYLAAEALARNFGHAERFHVPDLSPIGLMRLIS